MSMKLVVYVVSSIMLLSACASVSKSVRDDPMRCERDPKCERKRSGVVDCSQQCVDDPACMERCETIQRPNSGLGH